MSNKRGQDSFGMSFGMLFSIFLIIIFVAAAFMVIRVFLNFGATTNVGQFYNDLQDEIDSAWRSSSTEKKFEINLPSEITNICFINLSAPITANEEYYDKIPQYYYEEKNLFLVPPGAAEGLESKHLDNINIDAITSAQNPYCVKNPGTLMISKGMRSKLVTIR
jgi:hypothetical protein